MSDQVEFSKDDLIEKALKILEQKGEMQVLTLKQRLRSHYQYHVELKGKKTDIRKPITSEWLQTEIIDVLLTDYPVSIVRTLPQTICLDDNANVSIKEQTWREKMELQQEQLREEIKEIRNLIKGK